MQEKWSPFNQSSYENKIYFLQQSFQMFYVVATCEYSIFYKMIFCKEIQIFINYYLNSLSFFIALTRKGTILFVIHIHMASMNYFLSILGETNRSNI